MIRILIIGLGGFLGSIARYLSQEFVNKVFSSQIPLGTLVVNILGSFIIGLVLALSEESNLIRDELKFFLAAGFCGGFTTFSAFAYQNANLLRNGLYFHFFLYVSASVIVGVLAVIAGIYTVNFFRS